ncbi:MAG: ATP-dependent DNA helicase RecG [SAR86 cluster bacterium]|uniref:Probable DNA 3'-5' helicase RecG n=1 Tax=SAR86 cluster bacterium TaxID=2030880 RepID=A0A937IFL0_9GAMM|nr:ATP-dependent DNA helicase RecG [SAR86 cluster bacterium]
MSSSPKIDASSLLVTSIKGIGEKMGVAFLKLGIKNVEDLLFHFPSDYQDRTRLLKIADLEPNQEFVIRGTVEKVSQTFVPRKMLIVKLSDSTGHIYLRFFYYFPGLRNLFRTGAVMEIAGTSRLGRYGLETIHPDYELCTDLEFFPKILPKYRLTRGITNQRLRNAIAQAIQMMNNEKIEVKDYFPKNNLVNLSDSIQRIHTPLPDDDINDYLVGGRSPHRKRIGLEEIVANKISYLSIKHQNKNKPADIFSDELLANQIIKSLPFKLTQDQKLTYQEIKDDISSGSPMLRLLQGDVGSGKTIVAALIAASVVAEGKQVAILAPTTILAKQHYKNFVDWFGSDIEIELLTSKIPAKERREKLNGIANGSVKIVIGTHAVFQKDVVYESLSLVVYDEQHRFGVTQRLKLKEKAGDYPHQLLLSATPIPRTMAMSVLSGLDVSTIKSLPPNRKPIVTTLLSNKRREALINRIKKAIESGSQVYWVCPIIEESDSSLIGIEDLEKVLKNDFDNNQYDILHGKMPDKVKNQILENFKNKSTKILLATTVIEVGIDVPDANIMVIENSERFGLAQLHQLRGRVGRGDKESYCILMHEDNLSELSEKRLSVISKSNDGFLIAEEDLKLRGPGDILGLSQTGQPSFTFYDLIADEEIQSEANRITDEIMELPIEQQRKIIERWFPAHLELSDV